MSARNIGNHNPKLGHLEVLPEIYWLSLWQASGCDWSPLIQENCIATLKQSAEKEESKDKNFGLVLGGVLAIATLLVVATFTQSQQISQAAQEVGQNSPEQVIFANYGEKFRDSY